MRRRKKKAREEEEEHAGGFFWGGGVFGFLIQSVICFGFCSWVYGALKFKKG